MKEIEWLRCNDPRRLAQEAGRMEVLSVRRKTLLAVRWEWWRKRATVVAHVADAWVGAKEEEVEAGLVDIGSINALGGLLLGAGAGEMSPVSVEEMTRWRGRTTLDDDWRESRCDIIREFYRWGYGDEKVPALANEVIAFANEVYRQRDWEKMGVLGDMLEDAGAEDGALLRHLRGTQRCWRCAGGGFSRATEDGRCPWCEGSGWEPIRMDHFRGCWALEAVRGGGN